MISLQKSVLKSLFLPFFAVFTLGSATAYAQFVNIRLSLQPELETSVLSELRFGEVVINSGEKRIPLGDPNMGVFAVRAYNAQLIHLDVLTPETLAHENPGISDLIPIQITAAYNNTGENNYRKSQFMPQNEAFIQVLSSVNQAEYNWDTFYVYIFGNIEVGPVTEGVYEGEIRLIVDYQ